MPISGRIGGCWMGYVAMFELITYHIVNYRLFHIG